MPTAKRVGREAEDKTAAEDFKAASAGIFSQLESLARRLNEPERESAEERVGWAVDPTLRKVIGPGGDLRKARREVRELAARAFIEARDAYDMQTKRRVEIENKRKAKVALDLLRSMSNVANPTAGLVDLLCGPDAIPALEEYAERPSPLGLRGDFLARSFCHRVRKWWPRDHRRRFSKDLLEFSLALWDAAGFPPGKMRPPLDGRIVAGPRVPRVDREDRLNWMRVCFRTADIRR